jgi:predicted dinucleotide-binding enzyme
MDTPWTEIIKGTNNYTWFRAREIVTGWNTAGQSIEVAGHAEAVHRGEVIVLAVPFTSIDALLAKSNSISMSDHFRARERSST